MTLRVRVPLLGSISMWASIFGRPLHCSCRTCTKRKPKPCTEKMTPHSFIFSESRKVQASLLGGHVHCTCFGQVLQWNRALPNVSSCSYVLQNLSRHHLLEILCRSCVSHELSRVPFSDNRSRSCVSQTCFPFQSLTVSVSACQVCMLMRFCDRC